MLRLYNAPWASCPFNEFILLRIGQRQKCLQCLGIWWKAHGKIHGDFWWIFSVHYTSPFLWLYVWRISVSIIRIFPPWFFYVWNYLTNEFFLVIITRNWNGRLRDIAPKGIIVRKVRASQGRIADNISQRWLSGTVQQKSTANTSNSYFQDWW